MKLMNFSCTVQWGSGEFIHHCAGTADLAATAAAKTSVNGFVILGAAPAPHAFGFSALVPTLTIVVPVCNTRGASSQRTATQRQPNSKTRTIWEDGGHFHCTDEIIVSCIAQSTACGPRWSEQHNYMGGTRTTLEQRGRFRRLEGLWTLCAGSCQTITYKINLNGG